MRRSNIHISGVPEGDDTANWAGSTWGGVHVEEAFSTSGKIRNRSDSGNTTDLKREKLKEIHT